MMNIRIASASFYHFRHQRTSPRGKRLNEQLTSKTMDKNPQHGASLEAGQPTNGAGKCPVIHGAMRNPVAGRGMGNREWWPNNLNLGILHQHAVEFFSSLFEHTLFIRHGVERENVV